jgi:signal transduction histidine kinase/ActR/RegA family two-component response regulator
MRLIPSDAPMPTSSTQPSYYRRRSEALLTAEALQSAILNSANFSSIATDAKGVIQLFNVGAEHMLGYSAADVTNKITPADISDPAEVIARAAALSEELGTPIAPGFEALVFKASRGIEDIYELTYIRQDGSRFPAKVSVTALRDAADTIIGYLLIGTDNTARKQVEAEREKLDQQLRDQNLELEKAKLLAEQANRAKSDFLSNMSHELRSPLTAILGFAQLLESDTPPPTASQKESIDQVLIAGWYLLELINEILDLAVIESGRMSLSPETVYLDEVLRECQDMIAPHAASRAVSLHFPAIDPTAAVFADRTRVKQVLMNLLSNGVKYNRTGGSLTVSSTLTAAGNRRLTVTDTGAGLSVDQISQLFQPFNRLGQESLRQQGTGIGLVVSKRLTELMGGTIGVDSAVGVGSAFWVELESSGAPSETSGEHPAVVSAPAVALGVRRYTVLYIEDNPANLLLVEHLIARRPELVLQSATNARSGVALARTARPDLILMDINLPGLSGFDALQMLQADARTARIPVIAVSANAMPRDIRTGLDAGFFRYLTKPLMVPEFYATITDALVHAARERVIGATTTLPL